MSLEQKRDSTMLIIPCNVGVHFALHDTNPKSYKLQIIFTNPQEPNASECLHLWPTTAFPSCRSLTWQLANKHQTVARSPLLFPPQRDGEEKWAKGEARGLR